jgi:hypothetical protein
MIFKESLGKLTQTAVQLEPGMQINFREERVEENEVGYETEDEEEVPGPC